MTQAIRKEEGQIREARRSFTWGIDFSDDDYKPEQPLNMERKVLSRPNASGRFCLGTWQCGAWLLKGPERIAELDLVIVCAVLIMTHSRPRRKSTVLLQSLAYYHSQTLLHRPCHAAHHQTHCRPSPYLRPQSR